MFHPDNILKPEFGRGDRSINLLLTVGVIERLQSELRKAIAHTPYSLSNDARAMLGLHDLAVVEVLTTYLKDNKITYSLADGPFVRPEWLKGQLHALPGGSLLIREDDPSSIIAHTLS
jgi:1-phosphatidylinositol-3-phosphate 5-kinase